MLLKLKRRIEELEREMKRRKIVQTAKIGVSETTNGTILDIKVTGGDTTVNQSTESTSFVPRWL